MEFLPLLKTKVQRQSCYGTLEFSFTKFLSASTANTKLISFQFSGAKTKGNEQFPIDFLAKKWQETTDFNRNFQPKNCIESEISISI